MNTKIELSYQGKDYVLEYNRQAVIVLESKGFKLEEALEKPMTNVELMFQCAFLKNHPDTQVSLINDILRQCGDKSHLIAQLHTMINETYESLFAEPKDGESGNVTWKTVDLSPKKVEKKDQE